MKLTEKEVRYVADLANLSFSDEEVRKLSHELAKLGALTNEQSEKVLGEFYQSRGNC